MKEKSEGKQDEYNDVLSFVRQTTATHQIINHKDTLAINRAWYAGDQYVDKDRRDSAVYDESDSEDNNIVDNVLRPAARAWSSKMMEGNPEPFVKPNPAFNSFANNEVNRLIQRAVSGIWDRYDLPGEVDSSLGNGFVDGWASIVSSVVSKKGTEVLRNRPENGEYTDEDKDLGLDTLDDEIEDNTTIGTPEFSFEVVDALRLYFDESAKKREDMHWAIIERVAPLSRVLDSFGEIAGLKESDFTALSNDAEESDYYKSDTNEAKSGRHGSQLDITYYELFHKPGHPFPKGKHAIILGRKMQTVASCEEWDETIPAFIFPVDKKKNSMIGFGYITENIEKQKSANMADSKVDMVIEASDVTMFVQSTSQVSIKSIAGRHRVLSGIGNPPVNMPQPQASAVVQGHSANMKTKILGNIGLNPMSLGLMPKNSSGASSPWLRELTQSERQMFAGDTKHATQATIGLLYWCLEKLQKFENDSIKELVGEDISDETIEEFKNTKIRNYKLTLKLGVGYDSSPMARQSRVIELHREKILDTNEARSALAADNGIDVVMEDIAGAERKARRRLEQITNATELNEFGFAIFSIYDNLDVFMRVFKSYINSPEHDTMLLEDPLGISKAAAIDEMLSAMDRKKVEQKRQQDYINGMMGAPVGGQNMAQQPAPPPTLEEQNMAAMNQAMGPGTPRQPIGADQGFQ